MAISPKTAPTTILLNGQPRIKEALAEAAVTPGELIERTSTGTVQAHSTAAGNAQKLFAFENPAQAEEAGFTDYSAGDRVYFYVCERGDEVYALLTTSQTVALGDFLESAGDGSLQALATDAATDDTQRISVVAQALEAVTTTTAQARIRVEVV